MPRFTPATRIRVVEALTSLQRLGREMGHLSEMDEDHKEKKRAIEAVIKELQLASDDEAHGATRHTLLHNRPRPAGQDRSRARARVRGTLRVQPMGNKT